VIVWIGFVWLKVGFIGKLLQTRQCTFECHRGRRMSWQAERLSAIS